MATGSNEVDEIYHRMAVIRRELHLHVRESVAGAETMMDWGRYTWTYPWIAVGAASVMGYLVYTGRHQSVTVDTANLADGSMASEPIEGARATGEGRLRIGRKLLFAAWDIIFPVAVRVGQNYLLQWFEQQYPTRTVGPTVLPHQPERGAAGWAG